MSFHNSSHTSEHAQRCSQTWTRWTLFRDSCLESQNSGWPHCCWDEWFVWNKNKKKSIWKKAFPISQKSSGMRNIKQSRRWTQSECLRWISCHCHTDSRWPAAPPNLHLFTQKFLSLNNEGQLQEKAAEEEVVTTSLLVSVLPIPMFIWAQTLCVHSKQKNIKHLLHVKTRVQPNCCFHHRLYKKWT